MSRRLHRPRPIEVGTGAGEVPVTVGREQVEAIREEWLVEDRWWSERPISRHYFELALADGRCEVVFREGGGWYGQRA